MSVFWLACACCALVFLIHNYGIIVILSHHKIKGARAGSTFIVTLEMLPLNNLLGCIYIPLGAQDSQGSEHTTQVFVLQYYIPFHTFPSMMDLMCI